MKFSLATLFGAVYGHSEAEMSLQEEITLAANATNDLADEIGSGACQGFFGDDIYDLKPFDQMNRNMEKHTAALAEAGSNVFAYKLCQSPFDL